MLYHRPGTSADRFFDDLNAVLEKINYNCIIMGDFNINLLNYNNKSLNLVNHFSEYSFMPCITKPTRVFNHSATLIDNIWLNFNNNPHIMSKIILSDVTDHFPVVIEIPILNYNNCFKTISYRKSGEICDNNFKQNLEQYDFNHLMEMNEVDHAFEEFSDILYNLYDQSYPRVRKIVRVTQNKSPWLTSGIKESIKTKNRLYKKFMKRPITYGIEYRRYRNTLSKTIKASKNSYYKEKFDTCKGNSKLTWRHLNNILGNKKMTQSKIFKINNELIEDGNIIANKFNEYYGTIAATVTNNLPDVNLSYNDFLGPVIGNEIQWENTTANEIKAIVNKLNTVKEGPDKVTISVVKKNIDFLSPIISHLTNLSLSKGIFPKIHKLGILTPLYKSKDKYEISNYRPI